MTRYGVSRWRSRCSSSRSSCGCCEASSRTSPGTSTRRPRYSERTNGRSSGGWSSRWSYPGVVVTTMFALVLLWNEFLIADTLDRGGDQDCGGRGVGRDVRQPAFLQRAGVEQPQRGRIPGLRPRDYRDARHQEVPRERIQPRDGPLSPDWPAQRILTPSSRGCRTGPFLERTR